MSRLVARAENWETVYTAFQNINFAAFDYDTVKQSLIDYIKLYFPETFNDFIETDEFIAIIEVFAYISETLAYRFDIDAHENFMSVAQRKDSILRLAKFISYTPSRPLPARGLVKLTSVSTTESVVDANGIDLANQVIRWNDVSNDSWKDQFILIMNRVLEQDFGTVSPTDRFQIQDVLFEMYSINLIPLQTGTFSYSAKVNGQTIPLELVPIDYDSSLGIIERRPTRNSNFTILYGQDGLGDASDTTGFFSFTKQGTLQQFTTTFDGVTPNQYYDINLTNINDIDIWVNNVDSSTGELIQTSPTISLLPYKAATSNVVYGEWVEVDVAHAQNVIFNTNPKRNKYELETLVNNGVRIIFGDGEFADIPSGTFDIWARSSLDQDVIVPQTAVSDTSSSFTYTDSFGRTQTFTFTFSLVNSLQNASASEDLEHVRVNAPAVYYSQDRMVNGEDYNVFMLQDPSILKLRSINRTFAGDSQYIAWNDPSTSYSNVKIFGNDGILYFEDIADSVTTPSIDINTLLTTYIEPLLSSTDIWTQLLCAGIPASKYHNTFTSDEKDRLLTALTPPPSPTIVNLYYNVLNYQWYAVKQSDDPSVTLSASALNASVGWPTAFITNPLITVKQTTILDTIYSVSRLAKRLIFASPTTQFWNTNSASTVINYDTLNSDYDEINILQANINCNRTGILNSVFQCNVIGLPTIESGSDIGLTDNSRVSIIPLDTSNTGVPQGLDVNDYTQYTGLANIIKPKYTVDLTQFPTPLTTGGVEITLPIYYCVGQGDVQLYSSANHTLLDSTVWREDEDNVVSNKILLINKPSTNNVPDTSVLVTINEYVYQQRVGTSEPWSDVASSADTLYSYMQDQLSGTSLYRRNVGRSGLNFAWFHNTPRYYLVDPAPSNIIDTFVITKGYYLSLKRWLEDSLSSAPTLPTPMDLRTTYSYLINNKMISDTMIMHPGRIKLLFGSNADKSVQATIKVIKSSNSTLTDNQIKTSIIATVRNFFDITAWEFGETFYFTELATAIHMVLPNDVSSVVLVPKNAANSFGSLYEIQASEDEVFYPDITTDQIQIITALNSSSLNIV